MKIQKKWGTLSLAFALTLGFISSAAVSTSAATTAENNQVNTTNKQLDAATKQKVDTILQKLDADLKTLGIDIPKHHPKHHLFANLDEKTKAQAKEIMKKLKAGAITREQADAQFKKLGISLPSHPKFKNLDEKTKAQVKEIIKKRKDGTITKAEADAQLKKFGIVLPPKHHEKRGQFLQLDDQTKGKAEKLIQNAKIEIEKLGADFPRKYDHLLHLMNK